MATGRMSKRAQAEFDAEVAVLVTMARAVRAAAIARGEEKVPSVTAIALALLFEGLDEEGGEAE